MHRFSELESAGAAIARMTDRHDPEPNLPEGTGPVLRVKQLHGTNIIDAAALARATKPVEADAIVVAEPRIPIGVNIADCVPILLLDPEAPCAAAVHAGRRGLEQNIPAAAIRAMQDFGAKPERIHAAIGPSAGPCCYEVSPEMADEWRARGLPANARMLDLWAAANQQLTAVGIPETQITISRQCTICTDTFFSYRSGDDKPRNIAYIML